MADDDLSLGGIIGLAVAAGVCWLLWTGAKTAWSEVAGDEPQSVDCYVGQQSIYSGIAKSGLHDRWGERTLEDARTGQQVNIDKSATCVTRTLSPEMKKMLAESRARP